MSPHPMWDTAIDSTPVNLGIPWKECSKITRSSSHRIARLCSVRYAFMFTWGTYPGITHTPPILICTLQNITFLQNAFIFPQLKDARNGLRQGITIARQMNLNSYGRSIISRAIGDSIDIKITLMTDSRDYTILFFIENSVQQAIKEFYHHGGDCQYKRL